jgi:hypothetical protein
MKVLLDEIDPTFWVRFSLINPWNCYSFTKEKINNMKEAIKDAGARENTLTIRCDALLKLDDEVTEIKEQLLKWDKQQQNSQQE